ncbi:MAG: hypothetical protein ACI3W8_00365 [Oscillospiraceae bacterium]
MKRYYNLGGLLLCLDAERPLRLTPELAPYHADGTEIPNVTVHITWDWLHAKRPQTPPVGEDLLLVYYQEGENQYCELKGGDRGALACTWYTSDYRKMVCAVNQVTCQVPQDSERQILRMLPMREIFLHFGVLFLHASQVVYQGRGILFSAPSGTGKTTQARLWKQYRDAEIVCNDRTLVRKADGLWRTYGYPLDGSEPVRSTAVNTLGAVVLLEQGPVNEVRRMRPGKAASLLMGQTVIDGWNPGARTAAMELLLTMMEEVPVYLLTCTPDERAVAALEKELTKEGAIPLG